MGWLGNALNWVGQTFNPITANQWYAQRSAMNWQSGNLIGKALAITQDSIGGYVAAWTGQSASTAQAWWSLPWTATTFFVGGQAGTFFKTLNMWQGVSTGLCTSANALSGGAAVNPISGAFQIAGLGGSLLGEIAKPLMQATGPVGNSQYMWNLSHLPGTTIESQLGWNFATIHKGVGLSNIGHVADAFSFGGSVGDTLNRSIPNVGGILFENCDAVLTNVGEITGAYWDDQNASLVLVGKDGTKDRPTTIQLPGMDRELLNIALRASLAGQPIGVSIDPPFKYRESIKQGVNPPDGTSMLVSYLGNTEGTLFGAIMFEADRLLKCLDKGVHNETKKAVRATVPGFKTLLEMIKPSNIQGSNVWHRFWFVIDKVEIKHDSSSNAIAFADVRLKVLTETEMSGPSANKYIDSADEAFVQHLTRHYDEYAKDFPILARLKELAKITAIAKFLVNRKIPIDTHFLFTSRPTQVDTPSTTPGISVTSPNVEVSQKGNVIHTRTVSLFGGVDMDAEPQILSDVGKSAYQLRQIAEAARPSRSSSAWTFRKNGTMGKALAAKLGSGGAPFRKICIDHHFALSDKDRLLSIQRVYNSNNTSIGDFGPSWLLWVPFSITVVPHNDKRAEVLPCEDVNRHSAFALLILHDHTSAGSSMYRPVDNSSRPTVFCKITSQVLNHGQISFQYNPSDCIRAEKNCFIVEKDGFHYYFDSHGCLQEIHKGQSCVVRYHRENQRIKRIIDNLNHFYDIQYHQGRIIEIASTDKTVIHYLYNPSGFLVSCRIGNKCIESYSYDVQGRITEIRDHLDQVICRNVYNNFGEVIKERSDVVIEASGAKVYRLFEQGRLVSAKDEAGGTLCLKYGRQGELSMAEVKDHSGRASQLTYDLNGKLICLKESTGRGIYLDYDKFGRVIQCTGPDRQSRNFQLDDKGRVFCITDQDAGRWSVEYDNVGNIQNITDPAGRQSSYKYVGEMPVSVCDPTGEIKVKPRKYTLEIQTKVSNRLQQSMVYDRNQRLTRYKTRKGRPIRFYYDEFGNLKTICNKVGTTQYQINEKDMILTIMFGKH